MIEPDVLLPIQFSVLRQKPLRSEQRLLLAVLDDGIKCFQTYIFARRPRERLLFQEAETWIESTDDKWPFAFESICAALNFDANSLRKALRRWKGTQRLH
ncbi:MAG: hypothetical protein AB7G75_11885 [Candidatus Binatia bacterium]